MSVPERERLRKLPPVLRYRFTCEDGSVIERDFWIGDDHPDLTAPPDWLRNPRRSWDHPQDPVTFTGEVAPGREADARAALGVTS